MALPEALKGSQWAKVTARGVLPLLVAYAHAAKPVTYGRLNDEATRRKLSHHVMPLTYRYVGGAIGSALRETAKEWGESIPPINALIVNASTGQPGDGVDTFLKTYLRQSHSGRRLTSSQRESIVEEIHKNIFNFPKWNEVLGFYGLPSPPVLANSRKANVPTLTYSWSSEAESDEHRALKQYVFSHPQCVNVAGDAVATKEYLLPSADRIDVHFFTSDWDVAVEVKSRRSNDDDLLRGIFQCVKYREVLRALRRTQERIPQVRAVLVTERPLEGKLCEIAAILQVPCVALNLTRRSSGRRSRSAA